MFQKERAWVIFYKLILVMVIKGLGDLLGLGAALAVSASHLRPCKLLTSVLLAVKIINIHLVTSILMLHKNNKKTIKGLKQSYGKVSMKIWKYSKSLITSARNNTMVR